MFKKIISRERFFPSIIGAFFNYNYFCRKQLLNGLKKHFDKVDGKILDFGCGSKPYKSEFKNVNQYIGVDIENSAHEHINEDIDFFYDGKKLPFKSEEFDHVFTSEVLEHVPNIKESLSEIKRVLKPDGYILLSIPFVYPEHEMPYDFRRLTVNGMKEILTDVGFEIITMEKGGTFIEVIAQLIMIYLHDWLYTRNIYMNMIINLFLISPVCIIGILSNFIFPANKRLYLNMIVFAQKKNSSWKYKTL
jgi:SAM-dependent methyltransferase